MMFPGFFRYRNERVSDVVIPGVFFLEDLEVVADKSVVDNIRPVEENDLFGELRRKRRHGLIAQESHLLRFPEFLVERRNRLAPVEDEVVAMLHDVDDHDGHALSCPQAAHVMTSYRYPP